MRLLTLLTLVASALAMPVPSEVINADSAVKRDGSTEFDTDLCLLKREEAVKRGGIIGVGINNCAF
ncbi:hypothetical protein GGR50DRAFT_50046 [Xylaria sp. CBS 124048]|nr:hypothetical protein GGR50DRAFT_50046 [Xylaria sp. CBS 124048]